MRKLILWVLVVLLALAVILLPHFHRKEIVQARIRMDRTIAWVSGVKFVNAAEDQRGPLIQDLQTLRAELSNKYSEIRKNALLVDLDLLLLFYLEDEQLTSEEISDWKELFRIRANLNYQQLKPKIESLAKNSPSQR